MKSTLIFFSLFVSAFSFSQDACEARITESSEKHQLQAQFTCEPENFTFFIYDRSGKEIYKTDNPDFMWDEKKSDGTKAPEGEYFYVLKCNFGKENVKISGKFTLPVE